MSSWPWGRQRFQKQDTKSTNYMKKNDKLDVIKIKNSWASKDTVEWKDKPQIRWTYLQYIIPAKGLYPESIKKCYNVVRKETKTPITDGQKIWTGTSQKGISKWQ